MEGVCRACPEGRYSREAGAPSAASCKERLEVLGQLTGRGVRRYGGGGGGDGVVAVLMGLRGLLWAALVTWLTLC
jgi:hypothetical protein